MTGWTELKLHWRALAAATIGLSVGLSLIAYINSVFGPYLIAEFAWSRAEFAVLGATSVISIACVPIVGRLADLFGVRRVAGVGIVAFPLLCLALASQNGHLGVYFAIQAALILFCVSTTTTVYARVVAERFVIWRGVALAVCASGPALAGMVGSPLLTAYMDAHGWRAGYMALAGYAAIGGLVTLWLLPGAAKTANGAGARKPTRTEYREIANNPAFWIIMVSTALCSAPYALATSQLKLMLVDHGLTSPQTALMVSIFAAGTLLGRLIAGIALDHLPTHVVAAVVMGLPAVGLAVLSTSGAPTLLIGLSVALIGLSFGGETDILSYAAARYFPLASFSFVLGLMIAATSIAIALGSGALSLILWQTDSFAPFMVLGAICVLAGSINFLRLGSLRPQPSSPG